MPAMSFIGGGATNYQQWFDFLGLVKDKRCVLCVSGKHAVGERYCIERHGLLRSAPPIETHAGRG